MAYAFYLENWYAVHAGWFYCLAEGGEEFDENQFESAVQRTGKPREEAVASLLRPHLKRLGFSVDSWSVAELTEDYVAYEDFPFEDDFGHEFIIFGVEALFTTSENYPASKTIQFTPGHQALCKLLEVDEIEMVEMLRMERLIADEEEESEEEFEEDG